MFIFSVVTTLIDYLCGGGETEILMRISVVIFVVVDITAAAVPVACNNDVLALVLSVVVAAAQTKP